MEEIDDDRRWEETIAKSSAKLIALAVRAQEQVDTGVAGPLGSTICELHRHRRFRVLLPASTGGNPTAGVVDEFVKVRGNLPFRLVAVLQGGVTLLAINSSLSRGEAWRQIDYFGKYR